MQRSGSPRIAPSSRSSSPSRASCSAEMSPERVSANPSRVASMAPVSSHLGPVQRRTLKAPTHVGRQYAFTRQPEQGLSHGGSAYAQLAGKLGVLDPGAWSQAPRSRSGRAPAGRLRRAAAYRVMEVCMGHVYCIQYTTEPVKVNSRRRLERSPVPRWIRTPRPGRARTANPRCVPGSGWRRAGERRMWGSGPIP